MKKLVKRITLFFLLSVIIITGVLWTIAYKYEDDLKSFVISELQVHLTREIELGVKRMDYSILSHFPHISVDIPDLRIHSFKKGDQNLIKLKEISLVFDVFSILKGDLVLNEIFLKDGEINVIYNGDGLPNYKIWKETNEKGSDKSKISIENIELININISYQHVARIQDYKFHFDKLNIIPKHITDSVVLNSIIQGDILQIKQNTFLLKDDIPIRGSIGLNIVNDDIKFDFKGDLFSNDAFSNGVINQTDKKSLWDINFGIKNLGISKTVSILPNTIRIDELNGLSGNIDLKGSIKGTRSRLEEPSLQIDFKLNTGSMKSDNYMINNLTGSGLYFQPKLSNMRKAHVKINDFSFGFGASKFSGDAFVKNFDNPWLSTNIQADFNLNDIHEAFLKEQFQTLKGHVKLEVELEGNIKKILKKNSSKIKHFKSKGNIEFQNIEMLGTKFTQPFFFKKGELTFNNKHLNIKAFSGKVNNSEFEMTGRVSNFIETIFSNHPITFKSNLKIDKLKVEEFISAKGTSNTDSNYFFNLPKGIVLDVNLDLGDFSFRKFHAHNLKGAVLLKNQRLTFDDLKFQTCGGVANVSGKIDAKHSKKVVFECVTRLNRIDAREAFVKLENFGQDVLLAKHVKGSVSADIYLLAETDKQLNILEDKIYTKTKLRINDGELNDFGPLVDLQQFMSDEFKMKFDLKHLKFETLENDIEIIKKIIFIPEMAIRTNDVNLDISGKHTFEQEIDYLFKVKHSEIFKASKKNEIEAKYGVIENKDKTATLPLKMTGTVDNPKFSYDLKKKRDIIKTNIKDEIKSLGKILKDEFLGDKSKREKRKKEKEDLNIPREKIELKVGDIDAEEEDEEYEEEF